MVRLSVSLLGSCEVTLDGSPVTFAYDKVLALLAYLTVEADRAHRRDVLATLLWPDYPNRVARTNLRNALLHLRTAIGERGVVQGHHDPFLLVTRETIQFSAASDHWLDVEALANYAQAGGEERPVTDLCRGPFLEGFSVGDSAAFEEWALVTRERLEQVTSAAFEHAIDEQERQGALDRATASARRWVELQPWQESAHRRLMRLLALSGDRSAALRQYAECVRILGEELGAAPGEETTRLYQSIRERHEVPPAPVVAPPIPQPVARSVQPRPSLPRPATPFVGRERQLAEVRALLARPEVRLLTLTGVGGTGKTRLALQVAAGIAEGYRDGVYWIPLAPLRDPALVVPTVAAALGVRESGETPLLKTLKYVLSDREQLLVIDNFEQVVVAAPAVCELLAAAPGVKVLATSRAPLHVYGEQVYAVPPMEVLHPRELPSLERLTQVDAVSLYLQGAQRARPGFALDEGNAPAVGEICARLDGLPLAIELAASRARLFTPQAMLAHLGEREGDRLHFLTGGPRDAPARQRTLHATIAWSYDLLDPDEQRLFSRLSVFSGGCTLDAVEAVCVDDSSSVLRPSSSLDLLESLVDQSLLQVSRSTPSRFTMLETVREYAWERLQEGGETEAIRDRHAAYYAGSLQAWEEDLKGPRQLEALSELEADLDNARAAWDWAVERAEIDWLDRALEGLCMFYVWRGRYEEGTAACQQAVHRLEEPGPGLPIETSSASAGDEVRLRVLARALAWQGRLGWTVGEGESADHCLERAIALLDGDKSNDHEAQRAFVLLCMAERAQDTDLERARRLAERSQALYQALGDRWGTAQASGRRMWCTRLLGDHKEGQQWAEETLSLYQELGDRRGIADSLVALGRLVSVQGRLEEGEQWAREALAVASGLGDPVMSGEALHTLGRVLHDRGRFAEALAVWEELLPLFHDQGLLPLETDLLINQATTARHLGLYDKARAWIRAALPFCGSEYGQGQLYARCHVVLGRLALAEGAYEEAEDSLQQALTLYEGLGRHLMVVELRAALAYVERGRGRRHPAREHLCAALRPTAESHYRNAALQSLPAEALLLLDEGALERAVELYALVSIYPYAAHSRWFEDVAGREISAAAEALSPEVVDAAQERGCARDLWATVEELLDELGGSRTG